MAHTLTAPANTPIRDSVQFTTVAGSTVVLASELSSLELPNGTSHLGIRSARTGTVAYFRVSYTSRDVDGDVQYWDLSPIDGNLAGKVAVRLFND